MRWKLIFTVTVIAVILALSALFIRNRCEDYISNTRADDRFVEQWNRELFLPACNIKINYLVAYHTITKFPYFTDTVNIVLDGEPQDLSKVQADLIISTKKERLPDRPTPYIYLPYFVWAFVEKGIDPTLLLKTLEEEGKIPTKTKFCAFMYSNCDDKMDGVRNRKRFLELMNLRIGNKVDNLGRCYNPSYKDNGSWTLADSVYKPYKFVIAFENQQINGYITEKLIMPMIARAIPIYLGPDTSEFFNKKSYINVNDFPNFDACIDYVLQVDRDPELYASILAEPYFPNNVLNKELFSLYYGGKFYHDLYSALSFTNLRDFIRPCKFYSNNIRFITTSTKSKIPRIVKEAEDSGFFKECVVGEKSTPEDFLKQGLDDLEYGDFLFYLDPSTTINFDGFKRFKDYLVMLETSDLLDFGTTDIIACKKTPELLQNLENLSSYPKIVLSDNQADFSLPDGSPKPFILTSRKIPTSRKK